MMWETLRADEYCIAVKDGTHDTPKPVDFGYKLVTGKHVKNGQIDSSSAYYISEEDYNAINKRSMVERWDVIMSMIGTVGEAAVVKNDPDYAIKNVALFKCGGSEVRGKWLCYYLNSPEGKGKMLGEMKGSSQQFLSLKQLRELPIMFSEEKVPRIVEIISNYDDLIENNQKQIKLLEEAAQRLYKEWFVDLRFPGHENTKIVDGVPEGWQWCKVRDVADINSSALPKNYKEDFIDYVDLGSVRCGHIETRTRYNLNEAPGRAKRCARDGDIIWGMVRPNLKAYALVTNPKETDVFSTGFAVLSAKKVPYSYLYCAVTQEEFVGYLVNATNGAAYPAVKPVHFEVADILKPDDKVLEQFHSVADSIYRKKEALENQNHNLRESRDLILPKLMSGEVEV